MKNSKLILIALVLMCASSFGQTVKQKRAERQFNNFSFVKAIKTYEKLIDTSFNKNYAMRKLGDAYIMLRQPEKALEIYAKVVQQKNVPSEYFLFYAQTLRANGKYDESKKWMKKFKEAGNQDDLRVKEFFKNDDLASAIFNVSEKNTIKTLNLNTKYNDFGAVELNDNIVFASSRDEGVSIKRLYGWDAQPFIDIFQVPLNNVSVEATTKIEGDVNSIQHDGPAVFNADGTKMYFSRNNYYNDKKIEDQKGVMHLGIYTADYVDGKWVNIKPSNLNSPNYIVYHPTISSDGKKLYFASDMPGGFGGTDIYVSDVNEDGSLATPKNLGPIVNTEGNESFPFIYEEENSLYFSSNGHVGLGLLDVFATVKNENDEIVNVINLGEPINSKYDDFGYFLSKEGFSGYISSNRKGGVGGDDIYAFTRIPPLTLKGQIRDAVNNEPIEGAKVVLARNNGEELAYFITGKDGYYEHLIERDKEFVLKGSKEKYNSIQNAFNSFGLEKEKELIVNLDLNLAPIEDVAILADLDIIYFDLDKSNIRPDAALELDKVVSLMNKYPGMVIRMESHTDSRADDQYNIDLSNRRAKSTYEYIISRGIDPARITKYEGFGETQLVNKCSNGVKCTEAEHQLNRRTEFIIVKMK
ncbi:OmpA family protein [Lutibacter maritimus]|uniref:Outer membrane protein OmpA n=1 Tax=Lutibacter maritimus TaxID=593133 RepID=A0A1I6QQH2_9FLAO|nr:OmpA family protein [Lutibacter maritimus]SFS54727.1 Outer membrane protein OmpA [Lutibacter maritimus]